MKMKRLTTHTPKFLGLTTAVWPNDGGYNRAGEDIVIGFVDSGIYPEHPSFSTRHSAPYGPVPGYRGKCEIDPVTKWDYCNGKIVGAQHFAAAAIAAGQFNPAIDFASPLDGDGHGRLEVFDFYSFYSRIKIIYHCSEEMVSACMHACSMNRGLKILFLFFLAISIWVVTNFSFLLQVFTPLGICLFFFST